jgi:hypothetical protein
MDKKETLWICYRRGEKDKKGKKRRGKPIGSGKEKGGWEKRWKRLSLLS